jgi:phosphatidylinositol alpha-1,6-mannosyltransferase
LKILIYTHEFPPSAGGAGVYSYGIAKELSGLNHEVIVLTRSYSVLFDKKEPFKIIRKNRRWLVLFLIYYLRKYKPDHLLVTDRISQQDCSNARIFLPFKYSVVVHGSEVLMHPQTSQPYKRLWEKASRVMPVSEYTKRLLISSAKIPADKTSVVHGGIDLQNFSGKSNAAETKKKLGISDQKVILTLARLSPRKGQDIVIKSLSQIIKKVPNIKYIIAGEGEELEKLKNLVNEYKLNNHVIFVGHVPYCELPDYYDLCDVFVMPSRQEGKRFEGFGLSFLEANARGKPVIGGNHGGVPEAIVQGQTGLLVDPYSTDDLSNAIIKLLTDTELAQKMGRQGKERVFSDFSWENTARKIIETIKS